VDLKKYAKLNPRKKKNAGAGFCKMRDAPPVFILVVRILVSKSENHGASNLFMSMTILARSAEQRTNIRQHNHLSSKERYNNTTQYTGQKLARYILKTTAIQSKTQNN
jgi:hypothetical protein